MQDNVLVRITYSLDRERGLLISSSAVCAAQEKGRASRVIVRPDVEVCLPTCIIDVASRLRAMSFERVVHFGGVEFVVG